MVERLVPLLGVGQLQNLWLRSRVRARAVQSTGRIRSLVVAGQHTSPSGRECRRSTHRPRHPSEVVTFGSRKGAKWSVSQITSRFLRTSRYAAGAAQKCGAARCSQLIKSWRVNFHLNGFGFWLLRAS
jgi:hypothetical protein